MRIPIWLVIAAAVIALIAVLIVGQMLIQPDLPLIVQAGFSLDTITPNADGNADVTVFTYTLSRNATVSLVFEGESNQFVFRDQQNRIEGTHTVNFSGVVDGYVLLDEDILGDVERRLIPSGTYTWRLTAQDESGEVAEASGTFVVEDADTPLPLITSFTVPPEFTPNRDGVSDRVEVNVFLEEDADLRVFLLTENGVELPISAVQDETLIGRSGRHIYDYEGGVDLGADPPPDGTYTVVAVAQDAVGQRVRVTSELTIRTGGTPRAQIVPQAVGVDVVFEVWPYDEAYFSDDSQTGDLIALPDNVQARTENDISLPLGDMLVFRLTVENYGSVPIRTTGPEPGTVYEQGQVFGSLNWFEESGAWRVGIHCETSQVPYPYRWALGTSDNLVTEVDPISGNAYTYLPPGARAVVWGAVHITEVEARNPQNCYAGLIHEDVAIVNSNVGIRSLEIIDPDGQ